MEATPQQVKEAIIRTVFSPDGNGPKDEAYITHLKILEEPNPTLTNGPPTVDAKRRFIILSVSSSGKVRIHKSKENANGTFSVGKTWELEDLKLLEVVNDAVFVVGLGTKNYCWKTNDKRPREQQDFLVTVVRAQKQLMGKPIVKMKGFKIDTSKAGGNVYEVPRFAPRLPPINASISGSSLRLGNAMPSASFSPGPNTPSYNKSFTPASSLPPPSPMKPMTPPSNTPQIPPLKFSAPPSNNPPLVSNAAVPRLNDVRRNRSGSVTSTGSGGRPSLRTDGGLPPSIPVQFERDRPRTPSSTGRRTPVDMGRAPSDAGKLGDVNRGSERGSARRSPSDAARSDDTGRLNDTPRLKDMRLSGLSDMGNENGRGLNGSPTRGGSPSKSSATRTEPPPQRPVPLSNESSGRRESIESTRVPPTKSNGISNANGSGRSKAPPESDPSVPPSQSITAGLRTIAPKKKGPDERNIEPEEQKKPKKDALVTEKKVVETKDEEGEMDEEMILANVEEMLEGFEWRHAGSSKSEGSSDQIEKRLLRELKALEEASIFAIIESDERVSAVVKDLDEAIAELDRMDLMISLYKTQLLTVSDDISHIESQNRGLQVQTSNQRALLGELDRLLSTVNIPQEELNILKQEPMESDQSIQRLELSAATLYKALLSTRDMGVGDMVVANERLAEYRDRASQFCARLYEFLGVMFKFQIDLLNKDPKRAIDKNKPSLPSHLKLEEYLGRYCGLMLFVKEVDVKRFQQICTAYCTAAGDLYRSEMTELFAAYRKLSRKPTDDELEASFTYQLGNGPTTLNKPSGSKKPKAGDVNKGGMPAHQTFSKLAEQYVTQVETEQAFIADFLHTYSSPLDPVTTFADYMDLESYFKQGAAAALVGQQAAFRDIRQSLDSIFGFLVAEMNSWIESEVAKDGFQIVGILAVLDRNAARAEARRNDFLARMLQKQHQKASGLLEKLCKEQIKAIEQTKLTLKKRKGVVPFIRIFPRFVDRIESQVLPSDDVLPTRRIVNDVYDRIVSSMLESLQQMAKMDGETGGEDSKDQLNYHVILIENMHHFLATVGPKKIAPLGPSLDRARDLYDQNLNLYIKVVLRRPLSRLLDFFSGMEQLLRTTPPNEISLHSAYTRSSLKKTLSSFDHKDLKKAMEALSKRIDKHFGDISNPSAENTAAVKTVWKACEEEMTRLTKEWKALIDRCFPDDKVAFDFGVEEVQNVFKKNVPQSAGSA